MCECERGQNVKGCPIRAADEPARTHRGEGESPTPLDIFDGIQNTRLIRDLTNQATFFTRDIFYKP